jgi:hypothetical protein
MPTADKTVGGCTVMDGGAWAGRSTSPGFSPLPKANLAFGQATKPSRPRMRVARLVWTTKDAFVAGRVTAANAPKARRLAVEIGYWRPARTD